MIQTPHAHPPRRWPALAQTLALAVGVCAGQAAVAAPAELVVNGDFETGTFSGWTTVPESSEIDPSYFGVDGSGAKNGEFSAYFGDPTQTYSVISQTLATVAGVRYGVAFSLDSEETQGAPASFIASLGESVLLTLNGEDADLVLAPFAFEFVATGSDTKVAFQAYNTNSFYALDDVSVVAVVSEPPALAMSLIGLSLLAGIRRKQQTVA